MGKGQHTYIQHTTYNGHRDSMIESAQWADSMKIEKLAEPVFLIKFLASVMCWYSLFLTLKKPFCNDMTRQLVVFSTKTVYYVTFKIIWGFSVLKNYLLCMFMTDETNIYHMIFFLTIQYNYFPHLHSLPLWV